MNKLNVFFLPLFLSLIIVCNNTSTKGTSTESNSTVRNSSNTSSGTTTENGNNVTTSETHTTVTSTANSSHTQKSHEETKQETTKTSSHTVNPNYLFGFNTANAFEVLSAKDNDNVKLVSDIRPSILRFPGGTIANYYHVTGSGYGFREEDVQKYEHKMMNKKVQGVETGNNYIYDFIDFAKAAKVKDVIYVANILSADYNETETAIDILQNGGLNVVAVELGNELFSQTFRQYVNGIDGYINLSRNFAGKLKRKYPNIKLGVVTAPMGEKVSKNHMEWNNKLANLNFYDAVIFHAYPPTQNYEAISNLDNQFDEVKGFLVNYLQQKLPNIVAGYKNLFPNKELWVTEWNLPVSDKYANTMLHALFITQFQLQLRYLQTQYPNLSLACYHNLATPKDKLFSIINNLGYKNAVSVSSNYDLFSNMVKCGINEKSKIETINTNNSDCFVYANTTSSGKKNYVIINWSGNQVNNLFADNTTVSIDEVGGNKLFSSSEQNDRRFMNASGVTSLQKKHLSNQRISSSGFSIAPYSVVFINK